MPQDLDLLSLSEGNRPHSLGIALVCAWPMPFSMQQKYTAFVDVLRQKSPNVFGDKSKVYIYPVQSLHCTIATLRAFKHDWGHACNGVTGNDTNIQARQLYRCTFTPEDDYIIAEINVWKQILDEACMMEKWPKSDSGESFKLKISSKLKDKPNVGSTENNTQCKPGIIIFDDVDGAIERMRECLAIAAEKQGARFVKGIEEKCLGWQPPINIEALQNQNLEKFNVKPPPPHMPNIVHSTFFRWLSEEGCKNPIECQTVLDTACNEVPELFGRSSDSNLSENKSKSECDSLIIDVSEIRAVYETVPYMHMLVDSNLHDCKEKELKSDLDFVWWQWKANNNS